MMEIIVNAFQGQVTVIADLFQSLDHCIKIDLASAKGIAGDDVIWARGLPGIHAPESSGRLIAETFVRKLQEELS